MTAGAKRSAGGSDEALVGRLRRGDEEAFREIVCRYNVALRRMARPHDFRRDRLVGDRRGRRNGVGDFRHGLNPMRERGELTAEADPDTPALTLMTRCRAASC